jgi:succinoglycan biosynthesis transport protein ExoP
MNMFMYFTPASILCFRAGSADNDCGCCLGGLVTFKDLVRLLRRRWPVAFLSSLVVFAGFWVFSRVKEQPQFKVRAKVLLSTPPLLVTATQGTQWISVNQIDAKTWISIIQGRKIRGETMKLLREMDAYKAPGSIKEEWLATITAVSEGGDQLVWIEAIAPSDQVAVDIANTAARAAEADSHKMANSQIKEAIVNAEKNIKEEYEKIRVLELRASQVRDRARQDHGSDNLEVDTRRLHEEVLSYEVRRRELDRRASANRLRLERVRQDRSAVEHLGREAIPRPASVQIRVTEHPQVKALVERLEVLHRELNSLLRKYTNEHPAVKSLRVDLREAEVQLTRAESAAMGRDIDAEELGLRTDNKLIEIEKSVLEPDLKDLHEREKLLSPILEEAQKRDREVADARARLSPLEVQRAQLAAAPGITGYVQIQEMAEKADATPIEMKLRKSWSVALLAAIIFGLSLAFLVDFLDTTLRSDFDVRRHLDFPVIAVVPKVAAREVLALHPGRTSIVSEIFDTLATVLLSSPSAHPSRIFLVTSTNPQEGKTAVSTNLAVALARQGKRTLLVDGDMRIPAVHATLGLANGTGLSDLLAGLVDLGTDGVLQDIQVPSLKVMTSGPTPENPYELLDPARIAPVGEAFRAQFDAIVIDTPPVLRMGDALKFSTLADATLFVVKAGATDVRQATWAKRLLANVNAKVTGVVLNGALRESEEYYNYDPRYGRDRSTRSF